MADDWPAIGLEEAYKDLTETSKATAAAKVRELLDALRPYTDDLVTLRVAVEAEHDTPGSNPYRVRARLTARGNRELVVTREPADNDADLPLARVLDDAWGVLLRQLRDTLAQQRSGPHGHPERDPDPGGVGIVLRVDADGRHGHLKATDGREIYFADTAVVNRDFDALEAGAKVRFEAVPPDEGQSPRATTVHVLDARGHQGPLDVEDPAGWSRDP